MISHRHRCIFIHMPKTAGFAIQSALWPDPKDWTDQNLYGGLQERDGCFWNKYQPDGLQHLFPSHIRQEVGDEVFDGYFKFAFVRNPWDRALSQFSYINQRKRADLRKFMGGLAPDASFADYMRGIQRRAHPHWEPQHKFLFDDAGNLAVDFVGRYRHLQADFNLACERLRLAPIPLKRINVTKHMDYREFYDDESRDLVAEVYAQDIAIFGYSFAGAPSLEILNDGLLAHARQAS